MHKYGRGEWEHVENGKDEEDEQIKLAQSLETPTMNLTSNNKRQHPVTDAETTENLTALESFVLLLTAISRELVPSKKARLSAARPRLLGINTSRLREGSVIYGDEGKAREPCAISGTGQEPKSKKKLLARDVGKLRARIDLRSLKSECLMDLGDRLITKRGQRCKRIGDVWVERTCLFGDTQRIPIDDFYVHRDVSIEKWFQRLLFGTLPLYVPTMWLSHRLRCSAIWAL
ncbi:hypothetical protein DFH11DRAFT_1552433 [Phellopilus nigrolimitatus]|nr:hypothetical protein DFH11DRAFT_1552433 [Phellopilus nigrolimitatus]